MNKKSMTSGGISRKRMMIITALRMITTLMNSANDLARNHIE